MLDNLTNEQIAKYRRRFSFVGRMIKIYLPLFLFSNYIFYFTFVITEGTYFQFNITGTHVAIGAVVVFLMYYSLQRTLSVYNADLAAKFIYTQPRIDSIPKKLKFLFTQKEKLVELGIVLALYLIIPCKGTSPSLCYLIPETVGGFLQSLYVSLIALPVLLLVFVLANISAMNYWDTAERHKEADKNNLNENEQRRAAKRERKSYKGVYIGTLLAYFVGGTGLMVLYPFVFSGAASVFLFVAARIALYAGSIYLALVTLRVLRALRIRRKFIKSLKKLCKEKKMRISKIRYPYKSLFTLYNNEDFRITYSGKSYSCKILCSMKRGNPLFIMKNGIAARIVNVKFLRIQLFSYTKSFRFGWEADCKKIVIVNPTPLQILLPGGNRPAELDNGDIVDGYEIYAATAFLNALERDVIDID